MTLSDKIKFLDYRIVKGEIDSPIETDVSSMKSYDLNLDFNLNYDLDDTNIVADLGINIELLDAQPDVMPGASGFFHLTFLYNVENLNEFITRDKKTFIIDGDLGSALASISYSTARGLLLTKFQSTSLQFFVLPIIDPHKLLEGELNLEVPLDEW
jgi:hypothetical protein